MKILLLFVVLLLTVNFSNGQAKSNTTTTIINNFQLSKETRKSKIFRNIVDTIKTGSFKDYWWSLHEEINYSNQTIDFELVLHENEYGVDYKIKERNIFSIQLSKYDSVYVEGRLTNQSNSIQDSLNLFILNPYNSDFLPEKRLFVLPHFDSVFLTKQIIEIKAEMIADLNGFKSSWGKLERILNSVLKTYSGLRNDLAKSEWNKSFKNLSFNKQIAVMQYYPIKIEIHPNSPRILPPAISSQDSWIPDNSIPHISADSLSNYYLKRDLDRIINQ